MTINPNKLPAWTIVAPCIALATLVAGALLSGQAWLIA